MLVTVGEVSFEAFFDEFNEDAGDEFGDVVGIVFDGEVFGMEKW